MEIVRQINLLLTGQLFSDSRRIDSIPGPEKNFVIKILIVGVMINGDRVLKLKFTIETPSWVKVPEGKQLRLLAYYADGEYFASQVIEPSDKVPMFWANISGMDAGRPFYLTVVFEDKQVF